MLDTPKAFVAIVILVYFSANLPDFDKATGIVEVWGDCVIRN